MDSIHKLTELFTRLPGIGPRQAQRFTYYLLSAPAGYRSELIRLIGSLKDEAKTCPSCQRFHSNHAELCTTCADTGRDETLLMVVGKDIDLDNVERTKDYHGYYFVLGGTVPLLEKKENPFIKEKELLTTVERRIQNGLQEIVLAFSLNPEGEHTTQHVQKLLTSLSEKHSFKISVLGRGLSTGSELEYSDPETLKNALKNRV